MHSFKKAICIISSFIFITLCGCNQSKGDYVDLSNTEQKIKDGQLNISLDDFDYDDKPYNIMNLTTTVDSNYFYNFSIPNTKINLQNGRVQYVCQIPGCAHDEITSPGCISYQDIISPVAVSNGIYYLDGSKVMFFSGNDQTVILTNDYYTEYEAEIYPDNKSVITALVRYDNLLYIVCPTYFFTYNTDTKEITAPTTISDSLCMGFCATDSYLYFTTENLELYIYKIESGKTEKLADKVGQVRAKNGFIYYVKYENEIPILYTAKADGSESAKLLDDCYVNYYVTDNCIYYQSYVTKDFYQYDIKNKKSTKLGLKYTFSDGKEYTNSEYLNIVSTSGMGFVFIINSTEKLIFIFEDNSTEYKTIEMGEE